MSPDSVTHREMVASVQGVSRYFEGASLVRALNAMSFDVYRGETFGLLGPSGSGKSTILRILAGRLRPSEGKVKVFGGSPRRRSVKARVGYFPGSGTHHRDQFFVRLITFARDVFLRTKPEGPNLKSEIQRRTILARILLKNPDLVLLDEPFLGLDFVACQEIKEFIPNLTQRGKTVILSGDSLCDAKDVCNRMALCYGGRIEGIGTLAELLVAPSALRIVGHLLPQETAERALELVRHDLGVCGPRGMLLDRTQEEHQTPDQKPLIAPPNTAPIADKVLSPLLKWTAPKSSPISPTETNPPVDYELLATLTKPAPASTASDKPQAANPDSIAAA